MTLRDFNGLSAHGKDEVIALWGDYLTEKVEPGYRVLIYKINNFYVEVYHDTKTGEVKKYHSCIREFALSGV